MRPLPPIHRQTRIAATTGALRDGRMECLPHESAAIYLKLFAERRFKLSFLNFHQDKTVHSESIGGQRSRPASRAARRQRPESVGGSERHEPVPEHSHFR
jgi:hypothetical protein